MSSAMRSRRAGDLVALPEGVVLDEEFSPIEDVILPILRDALPDGIYVQSLVDLIQDFPAVIVRGVDTFGSPGGDERFLDVADFTIDVLVLDPDGDQDAARLSEACRVALSRAWRQRATVSGRGQIVALSRMSRAHRSPDWASSVGPVQYADLPSNLTRYESRFHAAIRKPKTLGAP